MSCKVIRNSEGKIIQAVAANGDRSVLFDTIVASGRVGEDALRMYAKMLTPEFMENYEGMLDKNGEPVLYQPQFDLFSPSLEAQTNEFTKGTIVSDREALAAKQGRVEGRKPFITVADKLAKKFGIPYTVVSRKEALDMLNAMGIRFAGTTVPKGFFMGQQVFFIDGEFNVNTVVEEFLHPFVNVVYGQNPALFNELLGQANTFEPDIVNGVRRRYTDDIGFGEIDRQLEIVTKVLSKYYRQNYAINEENRSFFDKIAQFIASIKELFLRLWNIDAQISDIPANLKYSEVAKLIESNLLDMTPLSIGESILDSRGVLFDIGETDLTKIKDDITLPIRNRVTEIGRELLTTEDETKKEILRNERNKLNQLIETVNTGLTSQDARFVTMLGYTNKLMKDYAMSVQEVYNSQESVHTKAAKIHAAQSVGTSIKKMLDNIRDVVMQTRDFIQEQDSVKRQEYSDKVESYVTGASEALSKIDTFARAVGKQSLLDIVKSSLPANIISTVRGEVVKRIDKEIAALRAPNKHFLRSIGTFFTDTKAGILGSATAAELREKKINELEAIKAGFPSTPEMIADLVNPNSNSGNWLGKYTNYVSAFMPSKATADPVVYAFKKWMDESQRIANTNALNKIQRSGLNKVIDEKKKAGMSSSIELHKNIVVESDVLMWDNKQKKYVPKKLKHLLRPWSMAYDNEIIGFRNRELEIQDEINNAPDTQSRATAVARMNAFKRERSDWYATHVTEKYSPVYKEAIAALPEEIRDIVEDHNTRRRDIREQIEFNYRNPDGLIDLTLMERLKQLDLDMKNRRSLIDEDGNLKTGDALRQAETLRQFYAQVREFFDYEPDFRGYNEMLKHLQNDIKNQTDPAEKQAAEYRLQKFIEANEVVKIEESWYEELDGLFNEMTALREELLGPDDTIVMATNQRNVTVQELWEEYREIRKLAIDRDGDFDPTALTAEQREVLDLYATIIEENRPESIKVENFDTPELKAKAQQLRDLYEKMSKLRKMELSKYYLQEAETMKESLMQAYRRYEETQDQQDYQTFKNVEEEFKRWYNENHYDEYQDLETRINAKKKELPEKVKRYWKKMVPVDTIKYTRREPGNLFSGARLKDQYINPNYREDSTGLPLPKAITDNGDGTYGINDTTSPYIDSRYNNLSPLDKRHLVELKNLLYEGQKGSSRKKYGHLLPALYSKTGEQILTKGLSGTVKSIATEYNETFSSEEAGRSFNDYVQLVNNSPIDAADQSVDATEAIIKFYYNAELNKDLAKKRASYEAAMVYMRQQQQNLPTNRQDMWNDFNRAIKLVEGEGKKVIYGNFIDNDSKGTKWLDGLTAFTGRMRTFANFVMHVTNYTSGYIQNLVMSADPSIGQKNAVWGHGYFQFQVVPQLLRYEGRFNDASKDVQLFRWFNLTEDGIRRPAEQVSVGRLARLQNNGGINILKEGGETVIAGSLLFSALKAKKVFDSSGKASSLLDAIEVGADGFILDEDGNVRIKQGYSFSNEDLNNFRLNLISKFITAQGNYNKQNATQVSRHVLGRFAELFRKYFATGLIGRVGTAKPSFAEQEEVEGFYRTALKSMYNNGIRTTAAAMFSKKPLEAGKVTELESKNLAKVRNELIYASALFGLGIMLFNQLEDEDETDIRTVLGLNVALILLRTSSEARTFSPIPLLGAGSQNAINILGQLSIAVGTLQAGYQLVESGIATPLSLIFPDNEWLNAKAFYQSSGGYGAEEGDLRLLKPIKTLTGFSSIDGLRYPKERIEFVLNPRQ